MVRWRLNYFQRFHPYVRVAVYILQRLVLAYRLVLILMNRCKEIKKKNSEKMAKISQLNQKMMRKTFFKVRKDEQKKNRSFFRYLIHLLIKTIYIISITCLAANRFGGLNGNSSEQLFNLCKWNVVNIWWVNLSLPKGFPYICCRCCWFVKLFSSLFIKSNFSVNVILVISKIGKLHIVKFSTHFPQHSTSQLQNSLSWQCENGNGWMKMWVG